MQANYNFHIYTNATLIPLTKLTNNTALINSDIWAKIYSRFTYDISTLPQQMFLVCISGQDGAVGLR